MKKILGLDLGITSIGWAYVVEGDASEQSRIIQIGTRIVQYDNFNKVDKNGKVSDSKNPEQDFASGKGLSPNADRTLKRGARRNLDRYQLRRKNLIEVLRGNGIISERSILTEDGKNTTHETWRLRAKAASERIEKEELARVLLAINKKRGYKSSRKAKNEDEGQAIDGMGIATRLYEEQLTPGQLAYQLLLDGKKRLPDFYRSDLQAEFDRVWTFQRQFYPEVFTNELYKEMKGLGQRATSATFWNKCQFNISEIKGKTREEKKLQAYQWRSDAVSTQLEKEQVAYVITEINSSLSNSSGYLGAISDRSKELYFKNETVGQNLFRQLQQNFHTPLTNQVFYRQDYLDEFETIWTEQCKHHKELTEELKAEIRDIIIFYQRKLKSQKGLVSFCEFEAKEVIIDGKKKTIGPKVAPKSSPLFQEFKIWQSLNNVLVRRKGSKKRVVKDGGQMNLFEDAKDLFELSLEQKQTLFDELNVKGNLKAGRVLEILGCKASEWELNYTELEGNRTNQSLYNAFLKIIEIEGYNEGLLKLIDKDEINVGELKTPVVELKDMVRSIFALQGIDTQILEFDAELDGKAFEQQASYQFWHLLYAYEGDDSPSGNEKLYDLLGSKFGFKSEHAEVLANVPFSDDYGSLSTKAMRKIYPHIKELKYDKACELAGFRHSAASITKDEIDNRPLKDKLELLPKNSLRNPVVEKILNQLVNVVNELIEKYSRRDAEGNIIEYFKFDEIRIELARDLKKNAKQRAELSAGINSAKTEHEKIQKLLQSEFGIKNPTRNDIIRYRLYEELKNNSYKDLYTNTYIPRELLFSKQIDIEHIIPQSKMFDDSFSNKTITYRKDNLEKGNKTALDFVADKLGEKGLEEYQQRLEFLYKLGKEEGISKAKYQKLLKGEHEIGDGFIDRDLRDSQYIAKKAKNMLLEISRTVVSTTGSITDRLREDWGLVNVMQELNFAKFQALGLTEKVEKKDGTFKERIVDWSKRNDHRHHAMDALTVAFTKHNHIQYLNYLNARYNENHKLHSNIIGIEALETEVQIDDAGRKKRVFKSPIKGFRQQAKAHLEAILVSHKAKNKVVTKNKNKFKSKNGQQVKIELTPRGQLHKETVYGKYKYRVSKEEKVSSKFDEATISKVCSPLYRSLLLERLRENDNDPKKAFAGKNALSKQPIYLDEKKEDTLPEAVKLTWFEEDYSIRKDVTPDNFKDEKTIEKVLDKKVKEILLARFRAFGDAKKAFSDLEKNPIWMNKEKGIAIKRVRISGVSNAESLHFKKDHLGKEILDDEGKRIPVSYVSTGNNHHVAIYRDASGKLQEKVVSLFEAVQLVNAGLPVIDKTYNQDLGWEFLFTMKQNEYFVFPNELTGFNPAEIDLLDPANKVLVSSNLFRVQKISTKNYVFNNHLETKAVDGIILKTKKELSGIMYHFVQSPIHLLRVIKVRLNHLGDIVSIGEY
jgi:CRISPR-associated endonuclease Csn1